MKQRLTALILLCALLTGCAAAGKGEQPLSATVLAMDTVMNLTLYGSGEVGEEQLRQALSGAEDTLRQLDAALTWLTFAARLAATSSEASSGLLISCGCISARYASLAT